MSVCIYDMSTLRRMEMLRAWGLCGIRRCEDKGSVVRYILGRHCVRGCYWDKAV